MTTIYRTVNERPADETRGWLKDLERPTAAPARILHTATLNLELKATRGQCELEVRAGAVAERHPEWYIG
jgi:hypothetical protein